MYNPSTTPEKNLANKPANKAKAATKIQAQLRGHMNRQRVAAKANANAATKIQAQLRGHMNRKRVAANKANIAMVDKFITNLMIQNNINTVNKNKTNKLRKDVVQLILKYYSINKIEKNINKQISNANRRGSNVEKEAILKLLNNQGNTRKKLESYMNNKNKNKNKKINNKQKTQ